MPDNQVPNTLAQYAAAREELLQRIAAGLLADRRFAAAWLLGSYGRGEQDAVSDIDLAAVVEESAAGAICAQTGMSGASAPPERMALFQAFGEVANLHENHHNAPEGGTFSSVFYRNPAVIVDWTLLPKTIAVRPAGSRLLFDRAGIGVLERPPEELTPQQRSQAIAERLAFFWMMAAVTAKYIVRERHAAVQEFLGMLESVLAEIEGMRGQAVSAQTEELYPNRAEQTERLRVLCTRAALLAKQAGQAHLPALEAIEVIVGIQRAE